MHRYHHADHHASSRQCGLTSESLLPPPRGSLPAARACPPRMQAAHPPDCAARLHHAPDHIVQAARLLYPARIRPPWPAALHKWRGSGLAALLPRAQQPAWGRRRSTNGGAAASLPFYPARIRPPWPPALHDDFDCNTDTDTKTWRGSGLAALLPRAHQAAVAAGPPQNGGAAASLPFCPARIRPPEPLILPTRPMQRRFSILHSSSPFATISCFKCLAIYCVFYV